MDERTRGANELRHEEKEPPLRYIDIASLEENDPAFVELKEKITQFRGVVTLLVHTHSDEGLITDEEKSEIFRVTLEKVIAFKKERSRFIGNAKKGMPTIVLMEERSYYRPSSSENPIRGLISTLSEFLIKRREKSLPGQSLGRYQDLYSELIDSGTLYYAITPGHDPSPFTPDEIKTKRKETNFRPEGSEKRWDMFCKKLLTLGVEKVIIRGAYYSSSKDFHIDNDTSHRMEHSTVAWAKKYGRKSNGSYIVDLPRGCVGETIIQLETRGIETILSNLTFPMKRNEPNPPPYWF